MYKLPVLYRIRPSIKKQSQPIVRSRPRSTSEPVCSISYYTGKVYDVVEEVEYKWCKIMDPDTGDILGWVYVSDGDLEIVGVKKLTSRVIVKEYIKFLILVILIFIAIGMTILFYWG